MTDAEVICTFMEPKPALPVYCSGRTPSPEFWWLLIPTNGGMMQWIPWRRGTCVGDSLDALHEVEARLTDEQRLTYRDALIAPHRVDHRVMLYWVLLHATAAQKIRALAAVLRPIVENSAEVKG